jgi:dipeptidyl aminopeptidase/acylaminoacyl peptidase
MVFVTGAALGIAVGVLGAKSLIGGPAPGGEPVREQLTFNGVAEQPAISPDGDFVAYVETRCLHGSDALCTSSLQVQEVGSTQPQVLIADAVWLDTPRWGHDGRTLVVGGQLDQERAGLFAVSRLSGTAQRIGPRGIYDTHPSADSVVLIPFDGGGTAMARVIGTANGAIADSFPVPFDAIDIAWGPGGRLVAGVSGNGVQIFDREGRTTASMTTPARSVVRWNTDGTALLFFRVGAVREDEFIRLPVDRDGAFAGGPEIVMARVPTLYNGEFDIARRTGRLALGTGDAITDLWTFDLTVRPVRARRESHGTTWYGDPALSLDGRVLYYYRGDALGDNIYRLDLETGTEEALTAQRFPGGNAARLSANGHRLAYGHNTGGAARLEYIEFPSRQVFGDSADIRTGTIVPLVPDGFVAILARNGRLAWLPAPGASWKTLAVPDSFDVLGFTASPDGGAAAFVATSEATTLAGNGIRTSSRAQTLTVGLVSLSDDVVRLIRDLEPDEPLPGIHWDADGTLYLGRWLATDERPSLWRLDPRDGKLDRIADLPVACVPTAILAGNSGRTATCAVDDFRGDIWLVDIAGITR